MPVNLFVRASGTGPEPLAALLPVGYGPVMSIMPPKSERRESASFGYRDIPAVEKRSLVRDVFESVADSYDVMNDLMSGGIHRLWKNAVAEWLRPQPGQSFIDVAGGTGDIAFRILDRLAADGGAPKSLVVCDLTPAMLDVGRDRAIDRGILSGIDWVAGNAESLPFADMSFDAYTIAFGLRNATDVDRALVEAQRVLKPGGRFLCLEFSHVVNPMFDRLYKFYSFQVLPTLGQVVTGDRDSYQYLVESIRRFPRQEELSTLISTAGLSQVQYRNLTGGIAALHSAWRI